MFTLFVNWSITANVRNAIAVEIPYHHRGWILNEVIGLCRLEHTVPVPEVHAATSFSMIWVLPERGSYE